MKQLYIDHDLPELLRIIYDFLEPPYTCILPPPHVPPPSAASLACICSYFSQLRRDQLKRTHPNNPHTNTAPPRPRCHLVRITRRRVICRDHCKAYPILAAVAKQSRIDTLRRWRRDYNPTKIAPILNIGHPTAYMHFESTGLAQFAPQLLPNIEFIESCCNKKGWKFRWRSKLNGYDSSHDSGYDSDSANSTNSDKS